MVNKVRSLFFLGTIIAFTLVIYLVIYIDKIKSARPSCWLTNITLVATNDSILFLHPRSSFKSIVHSAQLPQSVAKETKVSDLFRYELSVRDTTVFSDIMETFHKVMVSASIQYFLFEGSLLGSYRHHNIIPWDDDIDLFVNETDKKKMRHVFKNVRSQYRLEVSRKRYKFFNISGHDLEKPWKSPFLDISFYKENPTHLWDTSTKKAVYYNKSCIFPLADRPFLGHMYPAPRDPLRTLQVAYDVDQCNTGSYNHTAEITKEANRVATVPCSILLNLMPFVQHVRGPGGAWCEEVLTYKGQIISAFVRESTNIPVC